MEATLKALADPTRRRILQLVGDRELSAGEIAQDFDVTRPAISQHLGVLKGAGLLEERREGAKRIYRARPDGLDDVRAFLDSFWGARLDQLKAAAEQEAKKKSSRKRTRVS